MKTALIKLTGILATGLLFIGLSSCEKENEKPKDVKFESGAIEGMFYYYETADRVRVIDMDMPMRKSYMLSDDPESPVTLQTIVDENAEDVMLKAYKAGVGSPSYPDGMFIKPKMKEKYWLFPSNVIQNLVNTSENWDWWDVRQREDYLAAFIVHNMGKEDGEDTYAIESLHFPGQYITHQGHPIQGTNMLTYYPFPDKESAPRWRLFRPQGIYLEGNPELVSL